MKIIYFPKFFTESGLKKAESVSAALYKGSVDALASLSAADIKQSFAGATVCDILYEPGMTMVDLAMKAKCFPTERKFVITKPMNCVLLYLFVLLFLRSR